MTRGTLLGLATALLSVSLSACAGGTSDQSAPDRTAEALLRALGAEEYEDACRLYVPAELEAMGAENCLQLAASIRPLVGGELATTASVAGYQQDGDRAFVGSENVRISGSPTFIPLRFVRIDGKWYLTDQLFSID